MGFIDRRSGRDDRAEGEKQITGERRSGIDRRTRLAPIELMPSNEQLAQFARRLKRAMRDEKGRSFFGVASEENHFIFYAEVTRVIDWIDQTVSEPVAELAKPTLRKANPG